MNNKKLILIGEVYVDFSLATINSPVKLRLGGIVHAARGLWAAGIKYSAAVICPEYLWGETQKYLHAHGCVEIIRIGDVLGSPNIIVIGDVREVGNQGYEDLLRDSKEVRLGKFEEKLEKYSDIIIFPGNYDLSYIANKFKTNKNITIDIAYNINSIDSLLVFKKHNLSVAVSTSSELFVKEAKNDNSKLISNIKRIKSKYLLVKENRGGSILFDFTTNQEFSIPAILSETNNSVGVGDVYTAIFASYLSETPEYAAWRGMQVATQYAQTTFPDDLIRNTERELRLSLDQVKGLGGTILPWHERTNYPIYLAAPDFTYIDKPEIDYAVDALKYHNFNIRRPISENGQAPRNSKSSELMQYYINDVDLIHQCKIVLAIPLQRDPGTLVEIGMAIALNKPVITYDPRHENDNTMVICGSTVYSDSFDICLNGIFESLSKIRKLGQ